MARREGEERTVVVPGSFFSAIAVRLIKDFGPNAAEALLYDMGRDVGRAFARMAETYMGGKIREEADIRALVAMFDREYRWAELGIEALDVPEKYVVVTWKNGVGVPKGGSRQPVCHLGRGLLSGAAEVVFGVPCDAIETQCQATGKEHCRIVVGEPNRIIEAYGEADRARG